MPKYCGKDFVLLIGDGEVSETFTVVAAMQSTSFSISTEQVDVTNKDEMPWRQLFNCGTKSVSISANGFVTDAQSLLDLEELALSGEISNYRIISARGDMYTGPFQISSFERNGESNGTEQFSCSLESASEIVYTAAP